MFLALYSTVIKSKSKAHITLLLWCLLFRLLWCLLFSHPIQLHSYLAVEFELTTCHLWSERANHYFSRENDLTVWLLGSKYLSEIGNISEREREELFAFKNWKTDESCDQRDRPVWRTSKLLLKCHFGTVWSKSYYWMPIFQPHWSGQIQCNQILQRFATLTIF